MGDAVTSMNALDGEFDVVYDDIDKEGYPDAWRAARERVRIGGLYICDNVLWSGRVLDDEPDERTQAILEHNALIAEDERYISTIVPTRDGVMVASPSGRRAIPAALSRLARDKPAWISTSRPELSRLRAAVGRFGVQDAVPAR